MPHNDFPEGDFKAYKAVQTVHLGVPGGLGRNVLKDSIVLFDGTTVILVNAGKFPAGKDSPGGDRLTLPAFQQFIIAGYFVEAPEYPVALEVSEEGVVLSGEIGQINFIGGGVTAEIDGTNPEIAKIIFASYGPSPTDPIDPPPSDGNSYYNTVIHEEMNYDSFRGKWLSVTSHTLLSGRRGNTNTGSFYRGVDGLVFDGTTMGFGVPKGTLVFLSWTRSDADAASLEVLLGNVVVATLFSNAAGPTISTSINADFNAGLMSFRNSAVGNQTSDVQIIAVYKRRA